MADRKLRILLVSPKGEFLCKSREFSEFMRDSREMRTILHFWNGIGAGLPTVAALTPGDHEIRIIDENLQDIDFNEPADIVGITAMTQQATRAYEIAAEFRKRGCYIVIGGIHASVMPEEAQEHADSIFVGEVENTWPLFIRDFSRRQSIRVYTQADHPPVDMARIPTPRYDLIRSYKYPVIWLQTARGCPYDCEFCAATRVYGPKYKHKTVGQVVDEIKEVKKHWQHAQIGFADDNMFLEKGFSAKVLHELARLNFNWYAQTDISIAEYPGLLKLLHETGCRILFIGFESVSSKNVASFSGNPWKKRLFDRYTGAIEKIQKHGIGIYGSFILGFDGDDTNTVDATTRFINESHLMGAQVTILTPFPGSRLRTRLEQEKRILPSDWKWYTAWNAVIKHKNLSTADMQNGLLKIYRNIYSRESQLKRAAYFRKICEMIVN